MQERTRVIDYKKKMPQDQSGKGKRMNLLDWVTDWYLFVAIWQSYTLLYILHPELTIHQQQKPCKEMPLQRNAKCEFAEIIKGRFNSAC